MLEYESNIPDWGGEVIVSCKIFDMLVNDVARDSRITGVESIGWKFGYTCI